MKRVRMYVRRSPAIAAAALTLVLALVAGLVLAGGTAWAVRHDGPPSPGASTAEATELYIYSAKFVCGTAQRSDDQTTPVVPGIYRTVVNVHNFADDPVSFQKKAAVANPQGADRGQVSGRVDERLLRNEALGVDCRNIGELLPETAGLPLVKGFLVVESPRPLAVVAVYTAEQSQGQGISIDVETVEPALQRRAVAAGRCDLEIRKKQAEVFEQGATSAYEIVVRNVGRGACRPPTTVTDTLPFGITFAAADPPHWNCQVTGTTPDGRQVVECTYSGAFPPGHAEHLRLHVEINFIAARPPGDNCVEVKNEGDGNPANNRVCIPTETEFD